MPKLVELIRDVGRADVPGDERYEANGELFQAFLDEIASPDPGAIREALPFVLTNEDLTAKSAQLMTDRLTFRTFPSSERWKVHGRKNGKEHVSVLEVNEYGMVTGAGDRSRWIERSNSSFDFLKSMVASVDVIKAVILTRQRQVIPFLRPERDQGPLGFHFVRVDGEKLTDRDTLPTRRLEHWLLNSGDTSDWEERSRLRRPSLREFVSKLIFDTLSADACPIELVYTNAGKLSGWHNIDFSTIRLCSEHGYEGDDEIRAVQVIDYVPYAAYGYEDLLYPIRNPRTDIWTYGYGYAEPEMIVRAATACLNAVTHNAAGLDRNSIPRGILTLFGNYNQSQLNNFRREWRAMLTGAANRWTIPIMACRNKEVGHIYTPIDTNFNEMYFARWMTFLVSIVSGCFGIDPTEIHFDSFTTRAASLSGKDTEEKLTASRDKGLVPLLGFVEEVLAQLCAIIDPRYRFEFIGLHQEEAQFKNERLKLSSTINELREMDGKDPLPDEMLGNAPSNPALMQVYMAELQEQPGQPGEPGAGGDEAWTERGHVPRAQRSAGWFIPSHVGTGPRSYGLTPSRQPTL